MSWKRVVPRRIGGGTAKKAAVTLSGRIDSRTAATLFLSLRPQMLGSGEGFLPGARVAVHYGEDEHAGRLRVMLDGAGEFALFKAGGRALETFSLRLPWPEGVTPSSRDTTACTFSCGASFVEVTLPAWARPPAPGMAGAAAAANAAREKAGYVGVTVRVPDQAAQDRAATRRAGGL